MYVVFFYDVVYQYVIVLNEIIVWNEKLNGKNIIFKLLNREYDSKQCEVILYCMKSWKGLDYMYFRIFLLFR